MKSLRRHAFLAPRRRGGFALLEVIVAMVILGISIATLMRSFTLSLAAIRKNDATTQAAVLAETLLQNLESNPPEVTKRNNNLSGNFAEQGFPDYSYKLELKNEKIKYRLKTNTKVTGLHDLKVARGTIDFTDARGDIKQVADVYLILPPIERFKFESKFRNELFTEEEGIQQ